MSPIHDSFIAELNDLDLKELRTLNKMVVARIKAKTQQADLEAAAKNPIAVGDKVLINLSGSTSKWNGLSGPVVRQTKNPVKVVVQTGHGQVIVPVSALVKCDAAGNPL